MAYGDATGPGYDEPGTPDARLSARDLGRTAIGGVVPQVQEVTHEITANADLVKLVTTAGTRVALAASTPVRRAIITALDNNLGTVVVGGATVVAALGAQGAATRRGLPLVQGQTVSVEIANLANVYIDSEFNGDGVSVWYFT